MSTQKITMGRDKRQDAIDAENAMRQSGANPFVRGIDAVMNDGVGTAISETRNRYGNVNVMPSELLQGENSNFSYKDSPHNSPLEDYSNQTGALDYGTSATDKPTTDPEDIEIETSALDRRMDMIQKAAGNASQNLNANNRGM
jgi:hypothetical protein